MNTKIQEIVAEFLSCYEESSLFDSWDSCENDLRKHLTQTLTKLVDEVREEALADAINEGGENER